VEILEDYFLERKEKAKTIYSAKKEIYNPYFQKNIILNSDGFHHLQFSARRERNKREQLLKFSLLPLAFEIIKKSGTIQEYRKLLTPVGEKSKKEGSIPVKEIERIMPDVVFGAYTAYKFRFDDVPADYSEVYAYADDNELKIIKSRVSKFKTGENNPNLYVLKKDKLLASYPKIPLSQIFVDLWNLKEWYAKDFLNELENKIGAK